MARRSSSRTGEKPSPTGTSIDAGLRYLAGRAHSRLELRRKLARKGFAPDEVEEALARLTELGYLDDAAFADALVRRRSASRGPAAVAAELASKGIGREGVAAALAGFDGEAQLTAAIGLVERLSGAGRPAGYREMLDRVGPKLLRRGYSGSVVREACRTVWARTAGGADA